MNMIQTPIDSVAVQIGTDIGSHAAIYIALLLGVLNKYITGFALKLIEAKAKLPSSIQSIIALGFASLVTYLAGLGVPFVSDKLEDLPVILTGGLAWGMSMGYHSLVKAVLKDVSPVKTE
jgi:uncharacterized membrane protein (DUF441 family)